MRSRFERGERTFYTRLPFDDTRSKRGQHAVKTREKRVCSAFHVCAETRVRKHVHARVSRSVSSSALLAGILLASARP